jgi:hypothetical protein
VPAKLVTAPKAFLRNRRRIRPEFTGILGGISWGEVALVYEEGTWIVKEKLNF